MEDNKLGYYAIIPAFVRYDNKLCANEKLLYGEITSLMNKYGYCFATNEYFSGLYQVAKGTISRWISHLKELNYVQVIMIYNDRRVIIERRIFLTDDTYKQFITGGYSQNCEYPIHKNVKDNNINNKMIDDFFILLLNNSPEISKNFYPALEKLELLYNSDLFSKLTDKNKLLIKTIVYTLYLIYNSEFDFLLVKFSRESLINLYRICIDNPSYFTGNKNK